MTILSLISQVWRTLQFFSVSVLKLWSLLVKATQLLLLLVYNTFILLSLILHGHLKYIRAPCYYKFQNSHAPCYYKSQNRRTKTRKRWQKLSRCQKKQTGICTECWSFSKFNLQFEICFNRHIVLKFLRPIISNLQSLWKSERRERKDKRRGGGSVAPFLLLSLLSLYGNFRRTFYTSTTICAASARLKQIYTKPYL